MRIYTKVQVTYRNTLNEEGEKLIRGIQEERNVSLGKAAEIFCNEYKDCYNYFFTDSYPIDWEDEKYNSAEE